MLRVPDLWLGEQGHPKCYRGCLWTPRNIYLEDIEGSWPKTCMIRSSLMSYMIVFDPKEDALKVLCWYLYYKCVKNAGSRRGVLGGCWGILTRNLKARVILHVIDYLFLNLRKIPWKFSVDIFIRSVSRIGGSRRGGTWRMLRVPDCRLLGEGHPWCYGSTWCSPRIISWKFCINIWIFGWVIMVLWLKC